MAKYIHDLMNMLNNLETEIDCEEALIELQIRYKSGYLKKDVYDLLCEEVEVKLEEINEKEL